MTVRELRVIGPPGTGKTQYLSRQLARWREHGYDREEILVASFTRVGAREIADRAKADGVDVADHNIGTLHSLCYRALGSPEIAESHVKEWNEWIASRAPALALSGSGGASLDEPLGPAGGGGETLGDSCLALASRLRGELLPEEGWPESVAAFSALWRQWKAEHDLVDFTDLLERSLEYLDAAPGRPRLACFDETQDFSPLELALVRKWGAEMEGIVLVGDPEQCIFSFKGCHPRAFMEPAIAAEDYRVLSQSWRVPRAVHGAAVDWIARSASRYPFEYLPRDDPGSLERRDGGTFWSLRNPEPIVAAIEADARAGRTSMLLGSCAYLLEPALAVLRREGVPFHNPFQKDRGQWNPARGGVERLRAFLGPVRPDLLRSISAEEFAPRFWTYPELWRWLEILRVDGVLVRGAKDRVKKRAADEKRLSAPLPVTRSELAGLLLPAALEALGAAAASDAPWEFFEGRMLPEPARALSYALSLARRRGARALVDTPSLVVGTIHSVKGAQADSVYLSPDLSPSGVSEWFGGPEKRDVVRRVFYVGMTRARSSLTLLGPSSQRAVAWNE